jgi:hypothetical protein
VELAERRKDVVHYYSDYFEADSLAYCLVDLADMQMVSPMRFQMIMASVDHLMTMGEVHENEVDTLVVLIHVMRAFLTL